MENHNDNQSPPLPRHGTAAELDILRDRVPQTFDRYDLFDSNLAALLLHNDLVPEDMRSMLRNRMERDRDANFRPIPDLSGRRLAYEPGPAAMSGLNPTAPNLGSASVRPRATTATRANVGPSNSPASSVPSSPAQSSARSPSASPRPRTTDSQTAFDSPQDLVSRSQTPKSLGQASSASASAPGPWSPGATLLLFRLRAQGVSFPDCVAHFPGRSVKSCQEKWFKTNTNPLWTDRVNEVKQRYGGGRGSPPPSPPPPPAASAP